MLFPPVTDSTVAAVDEVSSKESSSIWPIMKVNKLAKASLAAAGSNPALARIDMTPSVNRAASSETLPRR
jgi:hypothetical protein